MDSKSKFSVKLTLIRLFLRPFRALLGQGGTTSTPSMDQGGTSSSSSRDSNSIQSYKYDVFISFRGPDTRNTFVDHLYAHLLRKGIFVFKDDTRLQKGESISPQLLQAIKHSRVSIVVFSIRYAKSTWCLDEMATIADCHTQLKQTVFPVFYEIDPSHVRKQNGVYQTAFALHTEQFKHDPGKVDRWKTAMTCLAGLAGWDVRDEPEFEEIEKIVQAVIKTLGHKFSRFADDLIGTQPHVEAFESHLKLSSKNDGFRVLGIWGMGGIGKTALATVLYDRISYRFDACCFIEDVSKIYRDGGAIAVQKQILCRTIEEKNLEAYSPSEISGIVTNRLHNIKLLIVLDDVDQCQQLQELHINPKLLRTGSRIIITTRDKHILKEYGADKVYEAQLMNDNDAYELLCRKAFKSDYSSSTFVELIPEVLKYTQRLPLAIRVIGSFLYARNAIQWRATLDKLRNNPPGKILKVLQVSYEGLEQEEKEIFLHVACFFKGEREVYVRRILDACGLHPNIGIPLITEKSLITIRNQEIHMHDMLQELGKQIVRGQNPDMPGLWSRLWLYQDFHHVMMTKTKAVEVKAVVLDQKEDGFKFNKLRAEDLSKMEFLTVLIICHKNFSGMPEFLSNSLRFFSWNGYPFFSLPSNFQPYNLVELNVPNSRIEVLWIGVKHLPNLKRMDLSNSKNLKRVEGFEGIKNLERLDLTGCINLLEVDPSIGRLTELVFLSLQNCSSLVSLSFGSVSRLSSLRVLRLSGCTKLENTPNFKGALNLEYLDMDECTSLSTIHESIGTRAKLRFLSLRDCLKFTNLPLGQIFNSRPLDSLIFLDVSFCNISEVPNAIGELRCLERLNLQGNNVSTIPPTIMRLCSLAYLNLSHCHSLQYLPELPTESAQSMGRYFKMTSGSRDHRSGLYIFDCPNIKKFHYMYKIDAIFMDFAFKWLQKLVKEPCHFRCGFDIVLPWPLKNIPQWFDGQFNEGSIVRIKHSEMYVEWVGFVFCVAFEVNNSAAKSGSPHHLLSLPLPYPFYLSFESEHTEECFDMPLSLELNKVDGSNYLWTIYISQEHCHFVKTGARITFKACRGLIMNEWGLRVLTKEDIEGSKMTKREHLPLQLEVIDNVEERSSGFEPKIQLPYNWLVSDEDDDENVEAKSKEINLSNLGLLNVEAKSKKINLSNLVLLTGTP